MAHQTRIGGVGYAIAGGRALIGGTGYGILGGKTLIAGTAYDIPFAAPLITFIIDTGSEIYTYQAEEGMTWEEFVDSSYNDGNFSILMQMLVQFKTYSLAGPRPGDTIIAGYTYVIS